MNQLTRRRFLTQALIGTTALAATGLVGSKSSKEPVIIVGGGPAGAAAALALKTHARANPVILIERDPSRLVRTTVSGPFHKPASADFDTLDRLGVSVMLDDVASIAWDAQRIEFLSGRTLPFGTLVVAPGTTHRAEDIAGLDQAARHLWPAAWGNVRDARRLMAQLDVLPAQGHVVLRLPSDAGGAPKIAAARAAYLTEHLRHTHPAARLTVLDSDPAATALSAFTARFGTMPRNTSWHSATEGGQVLSVDAQNGILETSAGQLKADVVNFVTPQRAASIASMAGLTDASGWCPCDPQGRSLMSKNAMVLGDARQDAQRDLAGILDQAEKAFPGAVTV